MKLFLHFSEELNEILDSTGSAQLGQFIVRLVYQLSTMGEKENVIPASHSRLCDL